MFYCQAQDRGMFIYGCDVAPEFQTAHPTYIKNFSLHSRIRNFKKKRTTVCKVSCKLTGTKKNCSSKNSYLKTTSQKCIKTNVSVVNVEKNLKSQQA